MSDKFVFRWNGLPHPVQGNSGNTRECTIEVNEGFWSHGDWKHLKNPREPWDDVYGDPDLVRRARELADAEGERADKRAILQRLADALRPNIETVLSRPLVLMFDLYRNGPASSKWDCEKWQLVTPQGALVPVKFINSRGRKARDGVATTAYFPKMDEIVPSDRWREVVRHLVVSYAKSRNDDGRHSLILPDAKMSYHGKKTGVEVGEEAKLIRFQTARSWGFDGPDGQRVWAADSVPSWDDGPADPQTPALDLIPIPRDGNGEAP